MSINYRAAGVPETSFQHLVWSAYTFRSNLWLPTLGLMPMGQVEIEPVRRAPCNDIGAAQEAIRGTLEQGLKLLHQYAKHEYLSKTWRQTVAKAKSERMFERASRGWFIHDRVGVYSLSRQVRHTENKGWVDDRIERPLGSLVCAGLSGVSRACAEIILSEAGH